MHDFSLEYIQCIRCGSKLSKQIFSNTSEINEGFLECHKCNLQFPIIDKIPILWDDFSQYLSSRSVLGGKLYRLAKDKRMRQFIKQSMLQTKKIDDRTSLEKKWSDVYNQSKTSKFYSVIKNELAQLPTSGIVLEYGCSIGNIANFLSDYQKIVFGIDRSYSAIHIAKKSNKENVDYFVADFLSPIFGKITFDLILALNVLELIEPPIFLSHISKQIKKGFLVISDPYDFDRGKNSVRHPVDEKSLRTMLERIGFSITSMTKKPSFYPWTLKINNRTRLNYKVDLIVGKKHHA